MRIAMQDLGLEQLVVFYPDNAIHWRSASPVLPLGVVASAGADEIFRSGIAHAHDRSAVHDGRMRNYRIHRHEGPVAK